MLKVSVGSEFNFFYTHEHEQRNTIIIPDDFSIRGFIS